MPTKRKKPAEKQRHISKPKMPRGRPFLPGKSGNPAGRPPGPLCLTDSLKKELDKPCPGDKRGRTWGAVLVERFLEVAMSGSVTAMKELFDRTDGRIKESIEVNQKPEVKVLYLVNEAESAEAWEKEHGGSPADQAAFRTKLLSRQR